MHTRPAPYPRRRQAGTDTGHQEQCGADHHQNADARQGAVRGADEPGHVAADGRDEKAHQRDIDQGAGHRRQHMPTETAAGREVGDQHTDRHHADEGNQGDIADRDVLLDARQQRRAPGGARPRGRHGGAQAGGHRPHQLGQRPYRRHADGAGADETHLVAPGVLGQLRHRLRACRERREVRYAPNPADQRTHEHRNADPQAHQMADTEQREGQQEIEAGHAAPLAAGSGNTARRRWRRCAWPRCRRRPPQRSRPRARPRARHGCPRRRPRRRSRRRRP